MINVANTTRPSEPDMIGEEDEETVERNIASVLNFSGYEPGSEEWTSAMLWWKRRRKSHPSSYKKFLELD